MVNLYKLVDKFFNILDYDFDKDNSEEKEDLQQGNFPLLQNFRFDEHNQKNKKNFHKNKKTENFSHLKKEAQLIGKSFENGLFRTKDIFDKRDLNIKKDKKPAKNNVESLQKNKSGYFAAFEEKTQKPPKLFGNSEETFSVSNNNPQTEPNFINKAQNNNNDNALIKKEQNINEQIIKDINCPDIDSIGKTLALKLKEASLNRVNISFN